MRTRGISIDAKTFDSLVNYFCNKGDLHKAAHLVDEMVLDGCIPDEVTWNAVVCAFWDRRKVRESAELVQVELMAVFLFKPEKLNVIYLMVNSMAGSNPYSRTDFMVFPVEWWQLLWGSLMVVQEVIDVHVLF
ncbi:Pentatricopeptide repeat-containing protein [Vitis vinifera]|uniref:Pentatricopeptide repeat-containing protein n=1 Tax=Vitis vinifera TaxID=29760 RepID=A0A438IBW1_VITVI|nr:Pentatricopeptide repeat-containing protein [Vitis vinifera]